MKSHSEFESIFIQTKRGWNEEGETAVIRISRTLGELSCIR